MKFKQITAKIKLSFLLVSFLTVNNGFSQCSIIGLDPTYCIEDPSVVLTGSPGGGVFSGPGMTGSTFDPSDAGVGIHTIEYTLTAAEDKYYIKSISGSPWGSTSNETAMTNAFGPGEWTLSSFEGAIPATVFSSATSFVFLEGSDAHALELNTFLIANLPLIESWVLAGGSLLINAAPNEGVDINFGFGGTILDYPNYASTVSGTPGHPAFVGPLAPTTTAMSGPYYGHGAILGAGYTNVLVNGPNVVLCEKPWGLGTVMMGGMTTANWHSPSPHGTNFRANIFTYLNSLAVTTSCVVTQDVEVFASPDINAFVDDSEICNGESVVFTATGGTDYVWDFGVVDGLSYTPITIGLTTYTVIGTDPISGCQSSDTISVMVHSLPDVTASVDPIAICIGDMATFTGGGASTYVWDVAGVIDGVPYEPLAIGTLTYNVVGTDLSTGCDNTASVDLTVSDLPSIGATASESEICLGESVTFNGTGGDSYVWDVLGVTDGSPYSPGAPGTFTFTVIGTSGITGCENIDSISVVVNDLPAVVATASEIEICQGETITLTGTGASSYTWDLPGVTNGVAYSPIGLGVINGTVTGTDAATGCANTASVSFTINPLPIVVANASTTEVCYGSSVTLSGSGASTYTWSPAALDGVPFAPGSLGSFVYTVTGTSTEGCSSSAAITINVIDCEPVVAFIEFNDNICVGDCITLSDMSTGPVISWDWDFGGAVSPSTSTESNPELCFNTVGNFTIQLTVESALGAISTTTHMLTVNENPTLSAQKDTIIEIGGSAELVASTSSFGSFLWTPDLKIDCDNCPSTFASPEEDVTYTVFFVDENGCTAQDEVMVLVNFVIGIGVPTAFSPNDDGNNDVLFVKGNGIESLSFTVYNRYGEVVFETTDQSIGWDGTFKERIENPGVFTWVLQYNLIDGKRGSQKGNTTLIR